MSALTSALHVGRRGDLIRAGYTRTRINTLIRRGELVRLGHEWLGTAQTPPRVAAALTRGARLTCIDAASLHGAWEVSSSNRHEVRLHGSPAPVPDKLVVKHLGVRTWPDQEPIVPLPLALGHVARCQAPDVAVMVFESVAHRHLLDRTSLDAVLAGLPQKVRRSLGPIDGRAMSGPESRVRRFFERRGVAVEPQWFVPGVGFTDMRVGESLIVECDSWTFHGSRETQDEDRRRDRTLVLLGYRVVRVSFEDVIVHWERTQRFLGELITRRVHRAPRSRRGALLHPLRAHSGSGRRSALHFDV